MQSAMDTEGALPFVAHKGPLAKTNKHNAIFRTVWGIIWYHLDEITRIAVALLDRLDLCIVEI